MDTIISLSKTLSALGTNMDECGRSKPKLSMRESNKLIQIILCILLYELLQIKQRTKMMKQSP